jgi:hypothetical protein
MSRIMACLRPGQVDLSGATVRTDSDGSVEFVQGCAQSDVMQSVEAPSDVLLAMCSQRSALTGGQSGPVVPLAGICSGASRTRSYR